MFFLGRYNDLLTANNFGLQFGGVRLVTVCELGSGKYMGGFSGYFWWFAPRKMTLGKF